MKLNLLKSSALFCGLFLLGACAQEAPQADNKTVLEDGPRVAVPIELEVSVDAFDAPSLLIRKHAPIRASRPLSRSRMVARRNSMTTSPTPL